MTASRLQLYSFFVSSSAHSVRIALNLKGLDYEYISVNLFRNEHARPEYLRINPLGYVPALVDADVVLADSFAITMYLEEKYPERPLLPRDLKKKALNFQERSSRKLKRICVFSGSRTGFKSSFIDAALELGQEMVINVITSSTQPLVRLPILGYVKRNHGRDEMIAWAHEHYGKGFAALEILLKDHAGKYATGDEIFLADVFLEPIITTSQRYKVDMSKYPLLSRLSKAYKQIPAFIDAMPENQPDFIPTNRGQSRI